MTPTNNYPHSRLPVLDGLRSLSALWVLLGHAHLFAYGWDAHRQLLLRPLNVFLYLHLAVVVFLVLSGYCLFLSVYQHDEQNKIRLKHGILGFFKSRALRILPAYIAILVLILVVNFFVPIANWGRHAAGLTSTIPWEVLLTNFTLMQDFFPQYNSINGPFWSIALEWHLYFLFPLFVIILHRFGGVAFLVIACLMTWGITHVAAHPPELVSRLNMTILNPPYFLYLFVFGIFAAWLSFSTYLQSKVIRIALIVIGVGCSAYLINTVLQFGISDFKTAMLFLDQGRIVDPIFGALVALFLVWLNAQPTTQILRKSLERPYLTNIGTYSYSLYLVHIPILAVLHHVIRLPDNWTHLHFVLLVLIGGALSLSFASAFSRVFETRRWLNILKFGRESHSPALSPETK